MAKQHYVEGWLPGKSVAATLLNMNKATRCDFRIVGVVHVSRSGMDSRSRYTSSDDTGHPECHYGYANSE